MHNSVSQIRCRGGFVTDPESMFKARDIHLPHQGHAQESDLIDLVTIEALEQFTFEALCSQIT